MRSSGSDVLRRLLRNKLAIAGGIIVFILIFCALTGGLFFDYETQVINQDVMIRLQKPSAEHWFGTDDLGRDVFARVYYGARYSLLIAVSVNLLSLICGLILGAVAGYYGGWLDMVIMRIMDVLMAIPSMLLAIAIVAALGSNMRNMMLALTISGIPTSARTVRGVVLTTRNNEYVEACRAIGAKTRRIIASHVLPNCMGPIIVHVTLYMAVTITSTAALSFLGLGIQPPMPEWGNMLSAGRTYIREYSYLTLFPGLAIAMTALGFNLLGDGLRDAFDPRLK